MFYIEFEFDKNNLTKRWWSHTLPFMLGITPLTEETYVWILLIKSITKISIQKLFL